MLSFHNRFRILSGVFIPQLWFRNSCATLQVVTRLPGASAHLATIFMPQLTDWHLHQWSSSFRRGISFPLSYVSAASVFICLVFRVYFPHWRPQSPVFNERTNTGVAELGQRRRVVWFPYCNLLSYSDSWTKLMIIYEMTTAAVEKGIALLLNLNKRKLYFSRRVD